MIAMLLAGLLAGPGDSQVVTRAAGAPVRDTSFPFADAEPDAITRGRTTTITVRGRSAEELRTLQVDPPDGVRLGAITPSGPQTVTVAITVDAGAQPGERELTLTTAPTIAMPDPRGVDPDMARQMEAFKATIVQRETKASPVGALHINGRDVQILRVEAKAGSPRDLRITVSDEGGEFGGAAHSGIFTASGGGAGGAGITMVSTAVDAEVRCGGDTVDSIPADVTVESRQGATVVLAARLTAGLDARGTDCRLRVRVEDTDGNISGWAEVR